MRSAMPSHRVHRPTTVVVTIVWCVAVLAQTGSGVVSDLNLYPEQNAADHRTEPFKILRGNTPSLVLRRGFGFKIGVASPALHLAIILSQGDNPNARDGSLVQLEVLPEGAVSSQPAAGGAQWRLALKQQQGQMRLLQVHIPVTAGVGRWMLTVAADGQHIRAPQSIYILFNPWLRDDLVFMENDQQREFYVMQDRGIIFHGELEQPVAKEWYYGQFEKATLPTVEFLFKISAAILPTAERGNPVAVARTLASAVNSKDNNGLIRGKWNPPFFGGVHPFAWGSSSAIINQYMEMGGNTVLYGQCYVFAAVLNTLLRAIGIPSRVVTNFPSVHTTDGAQVLDIRFMGDGMKPQIGGSIWNYHVWNEAWMQRPDLPSGYGGWQVLDGTPQGLSMQSHLFEVGPFPVRGVYEDKIDLPYDGEVARAAVKATYRYFIADPSDPSGWRLSRIQENQCGKLIVTETIGTGQMQDITSHYKRQAMALGRSGTEEPVKLKLRHDKSVPVGQPIAITCVVANSQEKPCNAQLTVTVTSVTYNNQFPETIATSTHNVTVPPGNEKSSHITIKPEDYIHTLRGECMISIEATATYAKDVAYARSVVIVKLPKLNIDLEPTRPNGEVHYTVSLKNTLAIPLTNCELAVELPGSTRFLKSYPVGSVAPHGLFSKKGLIFLTSAYTREINAAFSCNELPIVNVHRKL